MTNMSKIRLWRGKKRLFVFTACSAMHVMISSGVRAEWEVAHFHDALALSSGVWDGVEGEETVVPLAQLVEAPQAPWIRAHFGAYHLGAESYVTITSLADGDVQRLDARSMGDYQSASVFFNGDALDVQLHVAPGEMGIYITVNGVTYGDPSQAFQIPQPSALASLCGADNRVASTDARVGRLFGGGCTGWLVSNERALTAGHCGNPDGNVTGVMQFNVPASTSNGTPIQPAADDQYPVIAGSVTFESDGIGEDWSIFRVGPNSNTNLRPHVAQGFFRMTTFVPPADATMRVTGYGLDNTPSGSGGAGAPCCDEDNDNACEFNCNAQSLTEQTSTGRFDELSGTTLEYEVDTTPANSGSPVIRTSTGLTVGIHTAGGCDDFLSGNENHGTWFGYSLLSNALQAQTGSSVIWVDHVNVSSFQLGHVLHPAKTVPFGIALVPNGGRVRLLPGSYTEAAGNTFTAGADGKAMTIECPLGTAVIGN